MSLIFQGWEFDCFTPDLTGIGESDFVIDIMISHSCRLCL